MEDNLMADLMTAMVLGGKADPELAEAFNEVATTGSIFKNDSSCPVTDVDGDRLIKNAIYLHNSKKIRITDWRFGAGNFMDCYYWVWYIDENLKDGRMTVGVHYQNGLFGARTYPTKLVKV